MGLVKTTIDLPDEILKEAKATAALRGESLRHFVATAVEEHFKKQSGGFAQSKAGWRSVFGLGHASDIAAVDRAVEKDLETVDPSDWR
ncbi:MAG: hypothetical protein ABI718_04505 [Acidobacteriota bacterium]